METLKKLTPAETLVLRDTSGTSFRDLLKFTLIDLILKRVLIIRNESNEPESEGDNQVGLKHLEKGPAFDQYDHKYHELIYMMPFKDDPELSIQFKHLVKIGWESAKSRNQYMFRHVLMSKDIVRTVKEGWFYRTFGYCKLTDEGHEMQRRINTELNRLSDTLPSMVENNPEGAKDIMSQIYGNVLLLKSFDYSLLKQLDEVFEEDMIERHSPMDTDTAAIWFLFLYADFETTFNSEFDSYGAGGWSGGGCSGDGGGDGGCGGGCGGCGGCGG